MNWRDAARLIEPALDGAGPSWADLGAGEGTFTRSLAHRLGSGGCVYAVERDESSLVALRALAAQRDEGAEIVPMARDFTEPLDLPPLDGVLLANALHFVDAERQAALLRRLAASVGDGGRIVVVEYDDRPASRWVPFPVSLDRLRALAAAAGIGEPREIGRRRSRYGGSMYAACCARA
ncbi:MAG TPA: class I SAM-dependent methyltransferase [Gemmatimonadaceae bacterium]|nr:class I SAM-dependent methyltransferase [Gemmatimonadaceae bacterium]